MPHEHPMTYQGLPHQKPLRLKLKGHECVYCGEPSVDQEHFPPKEHAVHGFTLPVCKECKHLAARGHPYDFKERADFVKEKIRERLKSQLQTPDWSSEELEEVGHSIRGGIAAWQNMREIAKDRVAWNAIRYLAKIDESSEFMTVYVECEFLEANNWRW
jgi:hypothetical protein